MASNQPVFLPALRDMFPLMPDDVLLAALDAHSSNVEGAIGALLEMCGEASDVAVGDVAAASDRRVASATTSARHDSFVNQRTSSSSLVHDKQLKTSNPQVPTVTTEAAAPPPPRRRQQPGSPGSFPNSGASNTVRRTWGQLRAEQGSSVTQPPHPNCRLQPQQQQQQPGYAAVPVGLASPSSRYGSGPCYIPSGATAAASKPPALGTENYPALSAAAAASKAMLTPPAANAATSADSAGYGQQQQQQLQHRGRRPQPRQPAAAAPEQLPVYGKHFPSSSFGYADAARSRRQQQQEAGGWPGLTGGGGDGKADGEADGLEDWQAAVVEELCRTHEWAGRDLIEAVCSALQYDLSEVVSALDELHAASFQDSKLASPSSPSSTSHSSDGDVNGDGRDLLPLPPRSCDDDDAFRNRSAIPTQGSRPNNSRTAASASAASNVRNGLSLYDDDFLVQPGFPNHTRLIKDSRHSHRPGRKAIAAAPTGPHASRAEDEEHHDAESDGDGEERDAYHRHRRAAIKLTHAWRKLMNRASAAFAAGDRSLGRQLVEEAQVLRRQAGAAHREAAERIEAEMNDGRQLSKWELDLHGLHADEAVQALARRISALEVGGSAATSNSSKANTATKSGVSSSGTSSSGGVGAGSGPASARVLLASRHVLQVIVGRGLHSSGGEASLPRVVERYLMKHGYRFTPRAGLIEVQLRKHYAVAAAAPLPPQQQRQRKGTITC